ncbi:hypothetical protein GLOTRDRAFT_140775 [Gloeophyllum trabeum ATCC 11539]|uniref:Uncharacterized protein n=1 Tax=Gloeophyllum trabeum (strain ATCC 11539 / FP-39264 / Madison 617) TaxID=670483 RepID=S7RGT6_GLOTA|nr:uncharacterized protein GLOTRDRAFT_140775 [Gloeophyllum trabeum ATCC 11539]EPQ51779.1 hypothetical protein GLOTRDRAFT_140775 [Gloeophyllum trabeum ATCC 11539]
MFTLRDGADWDALRSLWLVNAKFKDTTSLILSDIFGDPGLGSDRRVCRYQALVKAVSDHCRAMRYSSATMPNVAHSKSVTARYEDILKTPFIPLYITTIMTAAGLGAVRGIADMLPMPADKLASVYKHIATTMHSTCQALKILPRAIMRRKLSIIVEQNCRLITHALILSQGCTELQHALEEYEEVTLSDSEFVDDEDAFVRASLQAVHKKIDYTLRSMEHGQFAAPVPEHLNNHICEMHERTPPTDDELREAAKMVRVFRNPILTLTNRMPTEGDQLSLLPRLHRLARMFDEEAEIVADDQLQIVV